MPPLVIISLVQDNHRYILHCDSVYFMQMNVEEAMDALCTMGRTNDNITNYNITGERIMLLSQSFTAARKELAKQSNDN